MFGKVSGMSDLILECHVHEYHGINLELTTVQG